MTYIPAPSFILFCQLSSCALYVKLSAVAGVVDAEPLEWEKSKKFALIVFGFIGTLFSNVTSLRVSSRSTSMPKLQRTGPSLGSVCAPCARVVSSLDQCMISVLWSSSAYCDVLDGCSHSCLALTG